MAALISISVALCQTPAVLCDHYGYDASALHGVSVNVSAFAGTHCAYPWRDGQAELTWVARCTPRWLARLKMVIRPSTNRIRCRLTSLIETNSTTKINRQVFIEFSNVMLLLSALQDAWWSSSHQNEVV